jgi:hypothetical protein
MKKFIVLSLILVLVSSVAFAQVKDGISIGGWGRASFLPLIVDLWDDDDRTEVYSGTGVTWGDVADLEISITGDSGVFGFGLGLASKETTVGFHDLGAHIWGKPFGNDWLTIKIGRYVQDDLRGRFGGDFDNGFSGYIIGVGGEDDIFRRFNSEAGAILYSKPIPALFIGLSVDAPKTPVWQGGTRLADYSIDTLAHVFGGMQVGIGYTIEGLGMIRAQFIGHRDLSEGFDSLPTFPDVFESKAKVMSPKIGIAFLLDGAVEGLKLDLGAQIALPYKNEKYDRYFLAGDIVLDAANQDPFDSSICDPTNIDLGASFTAGAFNITGRLGVDIGGYNWKGDNDDSEYGFGFGFLLTPSYDLSVVKIGASIGMQIVGESKGIDGKGNKDDTADFGFGIFVDKALANGNVTTGLTLRFPTTSDGESNKNTRITWPIILTYSF